MIIGILALTASLSYVCYRLMVTNIDVPTNAECRVSAREALHFALDNGLAIRNESGEIEAFKLESGAFARNLDEAHVARLIDQRSRLEKWRKIHK